MGLHNKQELNSKIKVAKNTNTNTIGKIELLYSGKSIRFTDPVELIKAYKESIDVYGISGVAIKITDRNPELAYEICVVQYGAFGEEPPSKEDFYSIYNEMSKSNDIAR